MQWKKQQELLVDDEKYRLVCVSIGVPEKGRQLKEYLKLPDDMLYVDPDNALYDALELRRGVQRTFFHPSTAFSFLDRFTRANGMRELTENVLPGWIQNALFIPPRQEQAFLQGGTFVFEGAETLYAHYDPSTAAHAKPEQVIEAVRKRWSL